MADQKISQLTALTALPETDDYFAIVDTSAGVTKKLAANYLYHTWATHTPTVTASTGAFITVAGKNRYFTLDGKTRVLSGTVYITDKGTAADVLRVTIPSGSPAAFFGSSWPGSGFCNLGALRVQLAAGGSYIEILKYDNTTVIATGASINYSIFYELE